VSSLLEQVVPLALAAAISPVLFLLQLNTLTGPRALARGSALTAGAGIVLIVGSTLGVALGGTGFSTRDTLQAVINIVFGVLLLAVGLRALLRPPKPKEPEPEEQRPASLGHSFLAGAGGMATNVTTFALYIPALALIAGSQLPLGQRGLAGLTILLVTLSVVWFPLLVAAVVPGASTRLLPTLGRWMNHNNRWIQVVLGFGFGIWLLAKGVAGL
jgi:threonine/homoserine/homoserine lactone efflux protein